MKYKTNIVKNPFLKVIDGDTIAYDRAIKLTFYDDNDNVLYSKEYGYVTMDDIHANRYIGLNCCYIKDINLENKEIFSFSAKDAFFDGASNFEGARFSEFINFEEAIFGDEVNFRNVVLNQGACFERTIFIKNVDFSRGYFLGRTKFDMVNFISDASFFATEFKYDVNFTSAKFNGEACFLQTLFGQSADFSCIIFGSNIRMGNAQFNDNVCFNDTEFLGDADFTEMTFFKDAKFSRVTFNGKIDFQNANFIDADFSNVQFNESANFVNANFNGELFLNFAIFAKSADLSGVKVCKGAELISAVFKGSTYFEDAIFIMKADFFATEFNQHVSMRNLTAEKLNLNKCLLEKTLDLSYSKIVQLSLLNIKNLGPMYLEWNREDINSAIYQNEFVEKKINLRCKFKQILSYIKQCLSGSHDLVKTPHLNLARQYRLLKENFRSLGQYDDEDRAYVQFRRHEALSKLCGEGVSDWKIRIWSIIVYVPEWIIKDFIGGYATNPTRILNTLIASIIFFSIVYANLGLEFSEDLQLKFHADKLLQSKIFSSWLVNIFGKFGIVSGVISYWLGLLYFSAITSFTVGYGDVSASNPDVAIVSSIQAFIGVFLMSYFTVAFARKILR